MYHAMNVMPDHRYNKIYRGKLLKVQVPLQEPGTSQTSGFFPDFDLTNCNPRPSWGNFFQQVNNFFFTDTGNMKSFVRRRCTGNDTYRCCRPMECSGNQLNNGTVRPAFDGGRGYAAPDHLTPGIVTCREDRFFPPGRYFNGDDGTVLVFRKGICNAGHIGSPDEEMSPGINARGSPVAAAVLLRCLNPAGLLPVAHPGCPMDHIQTLVNRSPGDLWIRMYRHYTIGVRDDECLGPDIRVTGDSILSRGTMTAIPGKIPLHHTPHPRQG